MQTSDYHIGPADSSPYLQMFSQVSLPITAIELTTLHVIVTEIGSTFTRQHRSLAPLNFFVLNHQILNGSKVGSNYREYRPVNYMHYDGEIDNTITPS